MEKKVKNVKEIKHSMNHLQIQQVFREIFKTEEIFVTEKDSEKWDEIISAMSMAEVRSKKIEAVKDNEWNKAVHWRQIEKLKQKDNDGDVI